MWEQRYGIISPERTPTNIRYYEDDDLKFLLNVALLNRNGVKISKIAQMPPEEIAQKVSAISEMNVEYGSQLDALTISMIEMDEYKFDRIVSANIRQLGFERTMLEVIYPFLDKLGLLWFTGSINPVQEHFMSNLIRQKLITAIDSEPLVSGKFIPKFIIYLPEGERQELSLLFMHYLLRARRNQVIYIGQDISINDLKDAYKIHRPDYIFTMISETFEGNSVQQYINDLALSFPDTRLLLSGYQASAQHLTLPGNASVLRSLEQTMGFLEQLQASKSNNPDQYPSN